MSRAIRVTVKVQFERLQCDDSDGDISYLQQDYRDVTPTQRAEYLARDRARLDAYKRGDWHFIGIRARAHVDVTRGKVTTSYTLDSPGLWGIESDSDDSYLESVFREEAEMLEDDIKAFGNAKR